MLLDGAVAITAKSSSMIIAQFFSTASTHSDIIDAAALHKITFTGFKSGEGQLCAG